MGQWVAAFLTYGLVLQPATTRLVAGMFTALTIADFLHLAYEMARKKAEQPVEEE